MSKEVLRVIESGNNAHDRTDYTSAVLTYDSAIEGMLRRYFFTRYNKTAGYDWRRVEEELKLKKVKLPRKIARLVSEFAILRWRSKRGPKYHWTRLFKKEDAERYRELVEKVYSATQKYLSKLPSI